MPRAYFQNAVDFRVFSFGNGTLSFSDNSFTGIGLQNAGGVYLYDDFLRIDTPAPTANDPRFFSIDLAFSAGVITGGTMLAWAMQQTTGQQDYFFDISRPAIDFNSVLASTSTADDVAMVRSLLSGDDFIKVTGGSSYLFSGYGNDRIEGANGNDSIYGGPGRDVVLASGGADHVYGGTSNDRIFAGGANDVAKGDAGNDSVSGQTGFDTVYGGAGNDTVNGDQGNDEVNGDAGNDLVIGSIGFDRLFGGTNNDVLNGGSGNDTLTGGRGNDRLFGSTGADYFHFRAGDGNDTIGDWRDGVDHIRVFAAGGTSVSFNVDYSGNNAVVRFLDVTLTILNVADDSLQLGSDLQVALL